MHAAAGHHLKGQDCPGTFLHMASFHTYHCHHSRAIIVNIDVNKVSNFDIIPHIHDCKFLDQVHLDLDSAVQTQIHPH